MNDQLLLTVREAAWRLGVGRTTVYALVTSGQLRSVQIGRARRIPVDALSDFVRSLGQTPNSEVRPT
jgi:excisionase family DNA binding protein